MPFAVVADLPARSRALDTLSRLEAQWARTHPSPLLGGAVVSDLLGASVR